MVVRSQLILFLGTKKIKRLAIKPDRFFCFYLNLYKDFTKREGKGYKV